MWCETDFSELSQRATTHTLSGEGKGATNQTPTRYSLLLPLNITEMRGHYRARSVRANHRKQLSEQIQEPIEANRKPVGRHELVEQNITAATVNPLSENQLQVSAEISGTISRPPHLAPSTPRRAIRHKRTREQSAIPREGREQANYDTTLQKS